MKMARLRYLFASLTFIGLLTACIGGGTDVGNPEVTQARVTGSLGYKNGQPAAWTTLKLRPKTYLPSADSAQSTPDSLSRDATTDTQGFFSFDSVKLGQYWVEGNDGHFKGVLMDLTIDGSTGLVHLPKASLDTTGTFTGVVTYPGGPGPLKIVVSTYGVERTTLTTSAGQFTISDLPAGNYTLHFAAFKGEYPPVDRSGLILAPGAKMVLDTLKLMPP